MNANTVDCLERRASKFFGGLCLGRPLEGGGLGSVGGGGPQQRKGHSIVDDGQFGQVNCLDPKQGNQKQG